MVLSCLVCVRMDLSGSEWWVLVGLAGCEWGSGYDLGQSSQLQPVFHKMLEEHTLVSTRAPPIQNM